MKKKDLVKILEKYDDETEVVIKDFSGASDIWVPKEIKYIELMKSANKILIN